MKRKIVIVFTALVACFSTSMYGYAMYDGQSDIRVSNGTKKGMVSNEYPQTEIEAAIAAIDAEVGESTDADMLEIANAAKEKIRETINVTKIVEIKELAIWKIKTIKDINAKIGDRTHILFYNLIVKNAMPRLKSAENLEDVTDVRVEIMDKLELSIWVYDSAKAEAQSSLPTDPEGTSGYAVIVTKGDKTLKLVNPDKVTYEKQ